MRVTEIIRGILNIIDGVERSQAEDIPADRAYSDRDIKRFKQIVDLADHPEIKTYGNEPNEQYADIEAVAKDAGADSLNATKHPADIRGEHPSLYPGTVYGAQ